MNRSFVIIGGGGHALVVLDLLESVGAAVRGYCAPDRTTHLPNSLDWLPADEDLLALDPASVHLACGIGSTGASGIRRTIFERFTAAGYQFPALAHPSAIVSPRALVADGAQIMMGACIQPGARIGRNVLVNTGARVDHDCRVGDHSHVAPGAVLAGAVTLGEGVHVGAGAIVIQNRKIGPGAIVAAGACVVTDVDPAALVKGVPARTADRN